MFLRNKLEGRSNGCIALNLLGQFFTYPSIVFVHASITTRERLKAPQDLSFVPVINSNGE